MADRPLPATRREALLEAMRWISHGQSPYGSILIGVVEALLESRAMRYPAEDGQPQATERRVWADPTGRASVRIDITWPSGRGHTVVAPEVVEGWAESMNEIAERNDDLTADLLLTRGLLAEALDRLEIAVGTLPTEPGRKIGRDLIADMRRRSVIWPEQERAGDALDDATKLGTGEQLVEPAAVPVVSITADVVGTADTIGAAVRDALAEDPPTGETNETGGQ